ncbi:VOC family protein [Shewanella sp. D64]|uniref:VOC family protein n=1 Tax=unclassified Shewanella TaxID=196818 RepID=UPI0022BA40E8|nr:MULTISPECIES: VOC family protein [unclassified Shewanella]MEC4726918.1 VOC family protein [Shewanella sp. D64]MEC4738585.1 VOC family protein [Shewanella sp. E94]WBJ93803.1 VOC family protein [Shewanella sp. MTB7]
MKEIVRINHVGLRVKSLAVSRAFYEQLGFEFIVGPIGPEPVAVMEHPCGININFILNGSDTEVQNVLMDLPEKHTGFTHIALEITDIDAVQQRLAELGFAITEGPITVPSGAMFIFIRDPDSNVVEFHQPAKNG